MFVAVVTRLSSNELSNCINDFINHLYTDYISGLRVKRLATGMDYRAASQQTGMSYNHDFHALGVDVYSLSQTKVYALARCCAGTLMNRDENIAKHHEIYLINMRGGNVIHI